MSKQIQEIKLSEIYASEEFNCRGQIAPSSVIELAKSIQEQGLIQPISVCRINDEHRKIIETEYTGLDKPDVDKYKYFLLSGFRRKLAHQVNKSETIDAIVSEEAPSMTDQMIHNLTENVQREDLNIIQEAQAISRLIVRGLNEYQIAEKLNTSRGWVQVRKMLVMMPPEVQQEFQAGLLLQTHIRDLYTEFTQNGKQACIDYAKEIKDAKAKGLTSKPKPKSLQNKNQKKMRSKHDIFDMMKVVSDSVGFGLHTRLLAWAAGEISDLEVHESIKEFANDKGLDYEVPELE